MAFCVKYWIGLVWGPFKCQRKFALKTCLITFGNSENENIDNYDFLWPSLCPAKILLLLGKFFHHQTLPPALLWSLQWKGKGEREVPIKGLGKGSKGWGGASVGQWIECSHPAQAAWVTLWNPRLTVKGKVLSLSSNSACLILWKCLVRVYLQGLATSPAWSDLPCAVQGLQLPGSAHWVKQGGGRF